MINSPIRSLIGTLGAIFLFLLLPGDNTVFCSIHLFLHYVQLYFFPLLCFNNLLPWCVLHCLLGLKWLREEVIFFFSFCCGCVFCNASAVIVKGWTGLSLDFILFLFFVLKQCLH